jgi:hypothetical protein
MSPNRIADLLRPIMLVLVVMFTLALVYSLVTNDYDSEEFTVTITYSCHTVLNKQNDYPDQVVDMCKQLQRTF